MKKQILMMAVLTAMACVAYGDANKRIERGEEGCKAAYGEMHSSIVEHIRLWPDLAPHEKASDPGKFVQDEKGAWRRYDVSQPELLLFRPEKQLHDSIVVVMPGGGYASQHIGGGVNYVKMALDSGRWAAVLHYRVPRRKGRRIFDAPREDAARAIRILRSRAGEFGYSPKKIGAVGFSAGGHLVAISAVSSMDALYDRVDEIDDVPCHLNFAIPVYPAYVLDDGAEGRNERGGEGAELLPEFKFDAKTPPMFMLHGDSDKYSPLASVKIYSELHRRKIPAQLFVFAKTGHGFVVSRFSAGWKDRILQWLDALGF